MSTNEARMIAEQAAAAAGEGRIDEARRGVAAAIELDPTDVQVLFLAFQFHFRIGELDEAERYVRRRLKAAGANGSGDLQEADGPGADNEHAARAYGNLGLIHLFRRRFDEAQAAMNRALEIDTRIGNEYGVARDTGNLGLVYETRDDLDRAEELYHAALALAERLGADELIATKCANLGDIAVVRGRPDAARPLWARAVEIFGRLGPKKHLDEYGKKLAELDGAENARRDGASAKPGA